MMRRWNAETERELQAELLEAVAGEVRFDKMTRGLYSTDASIYQIEPVGVIFPQNHADVVRVLKIANHFGTPVLPRGGGTSLSGQSIAPALILDFSRFMNRVLEIDPQRRLVRVEAGTVLESLNRALKPHGLLFGPDVSTHTRACIGGMLGNNSAGSHSLLYGKTIDHVRSLKVVLADGSEIETGPLSPEQLQAKQNAPGLEGKIHREFPVLVRDHARDIMARFPRLIRRVSGYNLDEFVPEFVSQLPRAPVSKRLDEQWPDRKWFNLSRLLVGSEGTLGIITEATLHAVPLPPHRTVACLQFESIDLALRAVEKILECQPSAVELLDKYIVSLSRENLQYRRYLDFVEGAPAALLIAEFMADTPIQLDDGLLLLEQKLTGQPGLQKILRAQTPEQTEQIWRCREAGAPLLLSIPGARKPIAFVEDPAVDPRKLADFTERFQKIIHKHGTKGAFYGHASVGCLHIRPLIDTKSPSDLDKLKAISDDVAKLVQEFRGSMTGEHGDGLSRSYHLPQMYGPKLYAAFQRIKHLFDPDGLLNPGKIVEAPSPIEHQRYGGKYHPKPWATFQDFTREAHLAETTPALGFVAAAEMCNGSGACRKTHTGTMCPSYMATRDEEHSPRGRANALRLALSGQLPPGSLTSERMHEVFDLCLQCKACKAECPSNVDVAKLKVEFLANYHQVHRPDFSAYVMGSVATLNRWGSAFAPFSNWIAQTPGMSWLAEKLLGIDRRRSLPTFHRGNFPRWFDKHTPTTSGERGTVVLLDDCLTSYCEPRIPKSAVQVLEHLGYRVERAGLSCCGRPLISQGLIDEARRLTQRNLSRLVEYVDRGWPILGVEPSCLLTLVDEYPDLLPSEAAVKVQKQSFLIDQWLATRWEEFGDRVSLGALPQTGLLHGHCQQKALVGTQSTRQLLQQIPELTVREVDAGCCGMAGSFGYTHYDVSQKIGQRVLFPSVEQHPEGPIIAPGFSCRHQIQAATDRKATHPIELFAQQLRDNKTNNG